MQLENEIANLTRGIFLDSQELEEMPSFGVLRCSLVNNRYVDAGGKVLVFLSGNEVQVLCLCVDPRAVCERNNREIPEAFLQLPLVTEKGGDLSVPCH